MNYFVSVTSKVLNVYVKAFRSLRTHNFGVYTICNGHFPFIFEHFLQL